MCMYFKTKTDVVQNLVDKIFLTVTVKGPFHRKDFKGKKNGGTALIYEETKVLYVELNERAEAGTSSYSAPGDFSQYIYFVLVAKNQKKIRSRCLVHEFSLTDINHG